MCKEIEQIINKALNEKYNDGRKAGYIQALSDFMLLLNNSKMTPTEIFDKLIIK